MEVNEDRHMIYAARIKDKSILKNSASGGVFSALSNVILGENGAIACAAYNYASHQCEFQLVTSTSERDLARKSKYMQSIPGDIFQQCYDWLSANPEKHLMFIGMGCQAHGFKAFAEKKGIIDRCYIVDIICHGSPSPLIWKDYVSELMKTHGPHMDWVDFKDKRNGWKQPKAVATINDNEVGLDQYVRLFYKHHIMRPACYKCPYTTVERQTDITIGDFWGVEKVMPDFYDPMGNSLVITHGEKGNDLFSRCSAQLDVRTSCKADCLQPNLIEPTKCPEDRALFWKRYHESSIRHIIKKYGELPLNIRIRSKLKSSIINLAKISGGS